MITLMLPDHRPLELDPATMAMRLRGPDVVISRAIPGGQRDVEGLKASADHASWRWPKREDMGVDVAIDHGRVRVRFSCQGQTQLCWPVVEHPGTVLAPLGEGLRLDLKQPFWRKALTDVNFDIGEGLTAPFFGVETPGGTLSYLFADVPRTEMEFHEEGDHLDVRVWRRWTLRMLVPEPPAYEVWIVPGKADPLAPALAFRQLEQERGRLVPLSAKIKTQPNVGKLQGAIHAYMWGDGRTAKAVGALRALGVDRAWLGIDGEVKDPSFLRTAASAGYLVGPYDGYDNVQDPASSDTHTSVFDKDLYDYGGILLDGGIPKKGFGGRGWQLSSEALRLAKRDWIGERVASYLKAGANSVFVDVDADGALFEDHNGQHRMTPWRDQENRLLRLRKIAASGLVVGSETGTSWATPALAFAHGAASVTYDPWWKLLKGFGGWGPSARPKIFFQPVAVTADQRKALFDPTTRLPLYQAVYHDALVSTERWELSPVKLKGLARVRVLQEMLYGVPSLWNLDQQALEDNGPRIRDVYKFFSPLHKVIATQPLTRFELLTPDRLVQRTRFGAELELTANFRPAPFGKQPPLSIMAKWLKTGRVVGFQPSPWWDAE
ncbi:MAG: hypothetical protein JWM80_5617 [Cyanobacteria bacterium RYN_339]|nr:hypothetical protein [Cyanobacteria bacterium RYN_339]